MRKQWAGMLLGAVCAAALIGCGTNGKPGAGADKAAPTAAVSASSVRADSGHLTAQSSAASTAASSEGQGAARASSNSAAGERNQPEEGETPRMLKLNGVIYADTGYVNSRITCGTNDAYLSEEPVAADQVPVLDGQTNFGKCEAQWGEEGIVNVYIDNTYYIFRDVSDKAADMPAGVAHLTGTVREVGADGAAVLTIAETNSVLQREELAAGKDCAVQLPAGAAFQAGDKVEIWYDGAVEGSSPAKLGAVYRAQKA